MGQASPLISVIMLTYNREQLVERAVRSIMAQTMNDFEMIIIDNGSTDQSGAICLKLAAEDGRIHVLRRERGTIGEGRNAGLDAARGAYIAFIDDDDTAMPGMLAFLVDLILTYDADIAVCGLMRACNGAIGPYMQFNELLDMTPEQAVVELLKRKRFNAGMPGKLWRRELFDQARFDPHGQYDDITIAYKLYAKARRTVALGHPQYCVNRHAGNHSAFTTNGRLWTPERLEEYFRAFAERTAYLCAELPAIAGYARYSEWSYLASMCNKIITCGLSDCLAQLQYARQVLWDNYDEFYYGPYIQPFEKDYMDRYVDRRASKRIRRSRCTGCGACRNRCPAECIAMQPDREGFAYPIVDQAGCTHCGQCKAACPVMKNPATDGALELDRPVYAAWTPDEDIRRSSSSGGVFSILAEDILSQGGLVAGARFNDQLMVEHALIHTPDELPALRGSKYVQSDMDLVYRQVLAALQKSLPVLFAGTPCQCAGLRVFLGKPYEQLYLCDFVCLGVNSPGVYRRYLEELETRYGARAVSVNFRDKTNGWKDYAVRIGFDSGQEYQNPHHQDAFMLGVAKRGMAYALRPCCLQCGFKGINRPVDITLGDFWGVALDAYTGQEYGGVSLVLPQSPKGERLFEQARPKLCFETHTLHEALAGNPSLVESARCGSQREAFYDRLEREPFSAVIGQLLETRIR